MMDKKNTIVTLKECPDLEDEFDKLHHIGWAKFMKEDPIGAKYWGNLYSWFPEFQYILLNEESTPMACGNSIPFDWDGNEDNLPSGWDGVFEKGILDYQDNISPNSLSALAIVIHPKFRGKGLSELMVKEMKGLAIKNRIKNMVAPVRPSLKYKFPLIPMKEYISWIRDDGFPFDPWIRTHYKTGASIIKVAERSMVIPASIEMWEKWCGMKFPTSGSYILNEGLVPLEVDKAANKGVYIEPNVWMRHHLG
ncbi:GNAT family N-acetyltransferase [Lysinibacillus pakistanensis]|uniref:GNAT family N-acetyltransferase n=1 Tax=Lysinibacillus pakistanensis TaxID=759811 RepID=A0AAX3WNR6_9BACI|nr:GNAT family N-acetyltransferase [Lysinibacillus pakistanensis]MDM5233788.1 GNAT family N-acetyltransferase [Lysinibacillus pakistanensis]WHY44407.1 GNAT family N-acetyltransferase [Lysinibacillus pakistanensis]WHY49416.1 GNAT family N-acetyltransferase [Lysinibacillus pakistanensis]